VATLSDKANPEHPEEQSHAVTKGQRIEVHGQQQILVSMPKSAEQEDRQQQSTGPGNRRHDPHGQPGEDVQFLEFGGHLFRRSQLRDSALESFRLAHSRACESLDRLAEMRSSSASVSGPILDAPLIVWRHSVIDCSRLLMGISGFAQSEPPGRGEADKK
jgi:hypothetical protein